MEAGLRRELLYGLEGIRLDAYDAIVKPDQVFAVRVYTLRRWAPILGATGFWLLVALQQRCYRNPRGDDWCVISRPQLAKAAAVSEATVHRYLHGDEYTRTLLRHWVQVPNPRTVRHRPRQWSSAAGRMTQPPNRYEVVMDAPLAPVDQRGLAQFLWENEVRPGTPAAEVVPLLRRLLGLRLADLLDLCDELAERFVPPSSWDGGDGGAEAFHPTVADVMIGLGVVLPDGREERARFLDLCSRVQQSFVGQTHLGTQYFLRQWLPLLGHKLALVVVLLRSRCFWNGTQRRDTVVLNFTDLAHEAGCSARWLRSSNEVRPESRQFFLVESPGRGNSPVFRVLLLEPIAPGDQAAYESLLRPNAIAQRPSGENGRGELLKAGQPDPLEKNGTGELLKTSPPHPPDENGTGELLRTGPSGQNGMGELLRTERANCSTGEGGTGELLRTEPLNTQNGTGEQHVSTMISVTNTDSGRALQQHPRAQTRAPAAARLLADFGIGPPTNRRILARGPDEVDVRGWMLYTLAQPGLNEPSIACGYVVNRLLAGERPPSRFRDWARLTPSQWQALWRAERYGGPYVPALPAGLAPLFDAWAGDFAGVFPLGPFGDDGVDGNGIRAVVARIQGPTSGLAVTVRGCVVCLQPKNEQVQRWLRDHAPGLRAALARAGILHRLDVLLDEELGLPVRAPGLSHADPVWERVLDELRLQVSRATFDTWIGRTRLVELQERTCRVEVQDARDLDWLRAHVLHIIERTLARLVGRPLEVELVLPPHGGLKADPS